MGVGRLENRVAQLHQRFPNSCLTAKLSCCQRRCFELRASVLFCFCFRMFDAGISSCSIQMFYLTFKLQHIPFPNYCSEVLKVGLGSDSNRVSNEEDESCLSQTYLLLNFIRFIANKEGECKQLVFVFLSLSSEISHGSDLFHSLKSWLKGLHF